MNPTDGSCWVVDTGTGEVIHVSSSGTELSRSGGFSHPRAVAANPEDGTCWVANQQDVSAYQHIGEAIHLSAAGAELWRGGDFVSPAGVAVYPDDGSCWVADKTGARLVHLAHDGTESWSGKGLTSPTSVAADPTDGSCWVADEDTGHTSGSVRHYSSEGVELWRGDTDWVPYHLATDSSDGSCWAAGSQHLVHYQADGSVAWEDPDLGATTAVAVDPVDHSAWTLVPVGVWLNDGGLLHLSAEGEELWRGSALSDPRSVAVNPADGSCWVACYQGHLVVHVAADGEELWRGGDYPYPTCWPLAVSVDPRDGSCWVAVQNSLSHLAEDGTELSRTGGPAIDVSVNVLNGSCWFSTGSTYVMHIAPDGVTALWGEDREGDCWMVGPLSVNARDGSCWVADTGDGQVVRYQAPWFADLGFDYWAYDAIGACALAGIVGGYPDGLYHANWPVTRAQMAVFVARGLAGGDENVPEPTTDPGFTDVDSEHWAYRYICYVVDQHIASGYPEGDYRPDQQVTRDQMAVYVARAMVAPTTSVLDTYVPADPRNFPDVSSDYWAYPYVEYCVEHDIVSGYLDGTYRPEEVVTRDQMAVYIARAFSLLL